VIVSTKAGRLRDGKDYSRSAIRESVLASLRALGRDRIDIVSVHDAMDEFDEVMAPGGAVVALRQLQEEGLVGNVGVGCADPVATARYVETGEFDVAIVANAWSLVNHRMLDKIAPAADRNKVGLIVATPLERGLLAVGPVGSEIGGRTHSAEVLDGVKAVESLCASYGVSLLAASLQWVTRHPLVASAIPGARSPGEARANSIAGGADIPESFWHALDEVVEERFSRKEH
jgi:D-threo-aldose 1-dehydrogenase